MTCKCPPTSPFLWRTNKGQIDTELMARLSDMSVKSTNTVNKKRREGVEPMKMTPMSNKPLAHTVNPLAPMLQTKGRKA